jgi:hypothetical protein
MSRDLRKYSQQTNFRLLIGFLVLLFLIGDGLIYYFYGTGAAVGGLLCLLIGTAPLLLIWGILFLMDLVVKNAGQEDDEPIESTPGAYDLE